MPSKRPHGAIVALLGLMAVGAVAAWSGSARLRGQGEPPPSPQTVDAPLVSPDRASERGALASGQTAPVSTEGRREDGSGAPPPVAVAQVRPNPPAEAAPSNGPSFDVVRVEPTGESVIAGRGAPGATIEMLRNGRTHARAVADGSGLFALVPPPLKPGSHEIVLQSIAPDGTRAQSRESVTVVIAEARDAKPLVTMTFPDRPTVVLSAPEPPETKSPPGSDATASSVPVDPGKQPDAPAQGPTGSAPPPAPRPGVKIASVEAEEGGRMFVSGKAAAGATVRLYLNESFIAPGGTGSDGKVSFVIGRGVQPGNYRVRLDDVDPVSGDVKSRAEVAFNIPAPVIVPLPPQLQPPTGLDSTGPAVATGSEPDGSSGPQGANKIAEFPTASVPPARARSVDPGTVVVPEINTTIVARGDSLWRLSRRVYGEGLRYTVIYDANQRQIRSPHLIYPGQLFVLPPEQSRDTLQ